MCDATCTPGTQGICLISRLGSCCKGWGRSGRSEAGGGCQVQGTSADMQLLQSEFVLGVEDLAFKSSIDVLCYCKVQTETSNEAYTMQSRSYFYLFYRSQKAQVLHSSPPLSLPVRIAKYVSFGSKSI